MTNAVRMMSDPAAMFIAIAFMLYVGVEAAIYVRATTYLLGYEGSFAALAGYIVAIFFVLRASGRFLGARLLLHFDWKVVVALCSSAIAGLFALAVFGGRDVAVFALPATGLFMSVIYPTLNSTCINCFKRKQQGAIAGTLLFFTCFSAVSAPLIMGAVGEPFGSSYTFVIGGILATALAILSILNMAHDPLGPRLEQSETADYSAQQS